MKRRSAMSSRQRVVTALKHKEPDRVPFDCSFGYQCLLQLQQHLGLQGVEIPQPGNPSLSVRPPLPLIRELDIDLLYVSLNPSATAPAFEYGMDYFTDAWGVTYKKVAQPFGISYEVVAHPLAEATLADLEAYPWPDPYEPALVAGLEERVAQLYHETDLALVGRFNNAIFEQAFLLRGLEQLFIDMALAPDFVFALLDKLTDTAIAYIQQGLQACGKYLQILRLAGDDMGHQGGTLISPRMFRNLIRPHFQRLYKTAKTLFLALNPAGKMMAHTDGDVYPFIRDYLEMGLDVLNPVQPYVAEMEHEKLKREFGHRLAFHGGLDIQHVLPFGTPEQVREEVVQVMRALGPGGGFILAPTHYLLPDVPPENILGLRDAVREFGSYPLSG